MDCDWEDADLVAQLGTCANQVSILSESNRYLELRSAVVARLTNLRTESARWQEEARQYCQNADYWRAENARLRGLVDGAFEVVELWGHSTVHNGQIEWAKSWLASARAALAGKE